MRLKNSIITFVIACSAVVLAAFVGFALFIATFHQNVAAQSPQSPLAGLGVTINPEPAFAWNGYTATFTVTVLNNTGSALTSLVFGDPRFPSCNQTTVGVAPGGTYQYICAPVPVTSSITNKNTIITNTMYVTGMVGPVEMGTGSAVNHVQVINPNILLKIKTSPYIQIPPSGVATVNMSITNTGDITLTFIRVQYNHPAIGDLPPGASTNCGYHDHITVTNLLAPKATISFSCKLTVTGALTKSLFFNLWARGNPPVVGKSYYVADTDQRQVLTKQTWVPIVLK